ncbi:MAG: hypothetical protein PHD01_08075 [Geobacteraceae bacterium]|nr:hypothetical protein [Geobacteraceae bacterium]
MTSSAASFLYRASTLLLLLLLGGCSYVAILQPLPQAGDPVAQALLEGEWLSGDTVVSLRFASNGIGCIAGLDWKDDHFRIEEGEVIVSNVAEKYYFSARFRNNAKWEDRYYFVRYRLTAEGDLLLWPPVVGTFEHAVNAGALAGTVERGAWGTRVTVSSAPETILKYLTEQCSGELFEYEDPTVLKRLFPRPEPLR